MDRTTNAGDGRSFETDGGEDTTGDSWDSTIEVDVADTPYGGTRGDQTTDRAAKQPLGPGEVYCWSCGVPIQSAAEICPQCGVRQRPPPTMQEKNPGLAALASVIWTGAGQIYNGELGKGIALMALMFVSVIFMFFIIGFLTTPLIWLYSVYDAYRTAERINEQSNNAF